MPKPGSSSSAPSRLPSTRESRPALIGLAVILIVGGALVSAWLAIQSGNRAYFVKVDSEVTQGAKIEESDLTKVSLPEDYSDAIPSDEMDDVVGQAATTRLVPGTVLTTAMVSEQAGISEGETELTIPADDSKFIRSLQPGAPMALSVGSSSDSERESVAAELVSVGSSDREGITGTSSDTINIVVTFDESCLSAVAKAIDDKAITPAKISGEGPDVRTTCEG